MNLDLLITCSTFLFFFLLFQFIARRYWYKRHIWICADYAWLSLAVAGIFGAVNEWRRTEAIWRANEEQRLFSYRSYDRASEITHLSMPFILEQKGYEEKTAVISEWTDKAVSVLEVSEMKIGIFIEQSEHLLKDGIIPADIYESVIKELEEQRSDFKAIDHLKEITMRSKGEMIGMAFTPLLLSIALSIRFGKVTAQLYQVREQTLLS